MVKMLDPKTLEINNPLGLRIRFLNNGLIETIESNDLRMSLKKASLFSKLGANLYLRKKSFPNEYRALIGPENNNQFTIEENSYRATGCWDSIRFICKLQLSEKSQSWQWSVELHNQSEQDIELDILFVQDVGLTPSLDNLTNEYYVSQYLERRILQDKQYGAVICCRQNMAGPTGNPWLMVAAKNSALTASVDGMQFYGSSFRETGIPEALLSEKLGGECSGELSIIVLQEIPFILSANDTHHSTFITSCLADHPQAITDNDLKKLPELLLEFKDEDFTSVSKKLLSPQKNIFSTSTFFPIEDLLPQELDFFFGVDKRHIEKDNGKLLSFFSKNNNHVVLRAKENLVYRPHAHIMQAKMGLVPDESIMSTTAYSYGVFNSHLTQGNTNFNRLLSICSSQFNLDTHTGQRIFIEIENQRYLLGVPSAFEIGLNHCRWIYKRGDHCFQVRTWTSKKTSQINMEFKVLRGDAVNLLVSHHFDNENGWTSSSKGNSEESILTPKPGSMIFKKFPKAQFRLLINKQPDNFKIHDEAIFTSDSKIQKDSFIVLSVENTSSLCVSFIGEVLSKTAAIKIEDGDKQFISDCQDAQLDWKSLSCNLSLRSKHKDVATIQEILPWYGINALTHFLTPHGLEQFDGAAWGTRDTNQGPFELLLSMRKFEEAKQVLRIIFSNQNVDGGWPQWWMFDSYSSIRAKDSHADVYHWSIISISNYIRATGDIDFLNEMLPYYQAEGEEISPPTPLSEHIDRIIDMIITSFVPETSLVPFGGGDWNDSMQPVSPELAKRLISSWTVELNYQAFSAYQIVCKKLGRTRQAETLKIICKNIKKDFNKYLIKGGTVSGHGLLEENGSMSLLLHPSDNRTNVQYRLLPMIRGIISGIFTAEQSEHHLTLIEQHLKGPDGARLMNRPLKYNGGIQTLFKRAESSPFFGREIGLMYTHAHLRYAESLAITGRADNFMKALRQAIPVGYRDIVACGDVRQANCYYSSSDVIFKNRYDADEKYDELKSGNIEVKGGWRIYSSGPGIYIGLIVSRLLGLRDSFGNTVLDPIIPQHLSAMSASIHYLEREVVFTYIVEEDGVGPKSIRINGESIQYTREHNPYRLGGALIPTEKFVALLNKEQNIVNVYL